MKPTHFQNGHNIPMIGFGLAMKESNGANTIEGCIDKALEIGYRHFDTAYSYNTEKQLGSVLQKWINSGKLKREEIFITTKLPSIGMHRDKVHHFIKLSLKNLQLDYIDLYLIHWPIGLVYVNDVELVPKGKNGEILYDSGTNLELIWKEMETLVDLGLTRFIGISNFSSGQVERICSTARIIPAVLQVEMNVYIQQKQLRLTCSKFGIHTTAYAPLGSPGRINRNLQTINDDHEQNGHSTSAPVPQILNDNVLEVANKHNKTSGQILLRFLTQKNISAIPKSTNPERMRQNLNSLDFILTPEDVKKLEGLDKGESRRAFDFFPSGKNHPEYPF